MKKDLHNLPLRSGVGIVVLNKENKVFVAKRIDNPKNFWQMPQGGVDEGEDFLKAAYRELEEETSIKNVELIKELDGTITYELPDRLLGLIWKGKYRGQKQKWFITRFLGEEKEINLNTKHPEFIDWKWIDPKLLPEVIVNFKKDLYLNLLKEINLVIG
jgi:putative (di)nucleoside polyphosphate hydrolase